jgi:hypothetical protein
MFHQSSLRIAAGLQELVYDVAEANGNDDDAADQLSRAVGQKPRRAIKYWLDMLEERRETPSSDRASRIAQAAITRSAVEPVEPKRVELFTRLDEMQSMPIADAYARLVKLVPELDGVYETLPPLPGDKTARSLWRGRLSSRLRRLIGKRSEHPDPLVRTSAMAGLAADYLEIAAGDTSVGTLETPHREIRRLRTQELEADGWSVEPLSGGRQRVSKSSVPT